MLCTEWTTGIEQKVGDSIATLVAFVGIMNHASSLSLSRKCPPTIQIQEAKKEANPLFKKPAATSLELAALILRSGSVRQTTRSKGGCHSTRLHGRKEGMVAIECGGRRCRSARCVVVRRCRVGDGTRCARLDWSSSSSRDCLCCGACRRFVETSGDHRLLGEVKAVLCWMWDDDCITTRALETARFRRCSWLGRLVVVHMSSQCR